MNVPSDRDFVCDFRLVLDGGAVGVQLLDRQSEAEADAVSNRDAVRKVSVGERDTDIVDERTREKVRETEPSDVENDMVTAAEIVPRDCESVLVWLIWLEIESDDVATFECDADVVLLKDAVNQLCDTENDTSLDSDDESVPSFDSDPVFGWESDIEIVGVGGGVIVSVIDDESVALSTGDIVSAEKVSESEIVAVSVDDKI